MMTSSSTEHIAITGTGRAGTTLLVQFFTALGFDTGYTLDQALLQVDPISMAGLEQWLGKGKPPHVVKSPWFVDEIDRVLETGTPRLEAVIIPIRDLFAAAESRRRIYHEAQKRGKNPLDQPGTIWKTTNPAEQETQLAVQLYKLLASLSSSNVPVFLLSFPKLADDPQYVFSKLQPLMEKYGKTLADVEASLAKVANPDVIHDFKPVPKVNDRRSDPIPFMQKVLEQELIRPTSWTHGDLEFKELRGEYYHQWRQIPGGHKKYSYFDLYEKLFQPLRNRSMKILEIGVYQGASLKCWRNYLGSKSVIVGIDIHPACQQFDSPKDNIHVRIGDQANPAFLNAVVDEFGPFDLIMDDGSHITQHQLISFRTLFERGLNSNGIYFIEDTNTSLWKDYCAGPHDIFDLAQACIFGMSYFYWNYGYGDYVTSKQPRAFQVPLITKLIEEVRIFDSAIAIYKSGPGYYPPLVKHN